MKRVARLIGFIAICLFFLMYMAAARLFLLFASPSKRLRLSAESVRLWARTCLRILGLKISTHGFTDALRSKRYLLVSNHQSYLDIVIIASVVPTLFVAKTEVSRWPLLGVLAKFGATIFVDRENSHSGVKCAYQVSRILREGINVQVFPEASTSDGATVMPFKGLFFASAIRSQTPIAPLMIKFQSVNGRPMGREELDLLCWYGDMDFARHFWRMLGLKSAEVSIMVSDPIEPTRALRAKDLAQVARERILRSFTNAEAIAAARAEVPVEFARAEDRSPSDVKNGNETATAADYIIGALLFSHFSSGRIEPIGPIREAAPQSENE